MCMGSTRPFTYMYILLLQFIYNVHVHRVLSPLAGGAPEETGPRRTGPTGGPGNTSTSE